VACPLGIDDVVNCRSPPLPLPAFGYTAKFGHSRLNGKLASLGVPKFFGPTTWSHPRAQHAQNQ